MKRDGLGVGDHASTQGLDALEDEVNSVIMKN
jgi:hypothetical protein